MVMITLYAKQKKRHRCTEQTWTLWKKARVGCFERTALKHVYYLGWNRSPAQVGCMRQVFGPGALGRPRIGWRGRWEGGSGWGIHVNPWLIHVNVWQKPLQYCKVISLQLIKINEKKKRAGKTGGRFLTTYDDNRTQWAEERLPLLAWQDFSQLKLSQFSQWKAIVLQTLSFSNELCLL